MRKDLWSYLITNHPFCRYAVDLAEIKYKGKLDKYILSDNCVFVFKCLQQENNRIIRETNKRIALFFFNSGILFWLSY